MAISKAVVRFFDVAGVRRRNVGEYTGPASYATGGDSFTPADVNLGEIEHASFEVATDGTNVWLLVYDYTNEKVMWFVPSTDAEVAAVQDMSGVTARFEVIGK